MIDTPKKERRQMREGETEIQTVAKSENWVRQGGGSCGFPRRQELQKFAHFGRIEKYIMFCPEQRNLEKFLKS